jgi:hypothetical protein
MGSKMEHITLRLEQRIDNEIKNLINTVVRSLIFRAKEKTLPKAKWYKAVSNNNKTIAYVCGKGNSIKTILKGNMIPYGQEI